MRKIRSYVSRKKRLTNLQSRAIETYSDKYCISFNKEGSDDVVQFLASAPSILEIGFGMGEVTAAIASDNRESNILGVEVFQPGVGKLLDEIKKRGLENVRIISHDVTEVIEFMIPAESLNGIHIFFPDPWPKKKHHKRRLMQVPFIRTLLPLLKDTGYMYAVTDWEDYAEQMLEALSSVDSLENVSGGFSDPIPWRPTSKFEQKGMAKDHVIRELFFRKRKR